MGSDTRVILVPSIRDANHDFVFPQVNINSTSAQVGDVSFLSFCFISLARLVLHGAFHQDNI
jgi:hypothetical protein